MTNLGTYGVDRFAGVINPPQAALLCVGAIKRKPAVPPDGEAIAIRSMMSLTLACDHRILYGADGAQFLSRIRSLLQSPLSLVL